MLSTPSLPPALSLLLAALIVLGIVLLIRWLTRTGVLRAMLFGGIGALASLRALFARVCARAGALCQAVAGAALRALALPTSAPASRSTARLGASSGQGSDRAPLSTRSPDIGPLPPTPSTRPSGLPLIARAVPAVPAASLVLAEQTWPGITLIARLLQAGLVACLILTEYAVNVLRVPAVQFGLGGQSSGLHLPLDVLAALLWLALALFWGSLLLEMLGLVPANVRLFSELSRAARWALTSLAGVSFLLVALCMGLLYWTARGLSRTAAASLEWPTCSASRRECSSPQLDCLVCGHLSSESAPYWSSLPRRLG